jgi:hypothetical protein
VQSASLTQDAKDAETMLQCLLIGIPPQLIDAAKSQDPPMNVLFEVGTDRTAKAVHKSHLKKYKTVLVAIGKRFQNRVPNKVTCRDALQQLDDKFEHKLSHARMRKSKGALQPNKSDKYAWAKENGDALSRLMQWSWRLLSRTKNSKDPDVQDIKDAWKSVTKDTGGVGKDTGADEEADKDTGADEEADKGGIGEDDAQTDDENEEQEEEGEDEAEDKFGKEEVAGSGDEADHAPDSAPLASTLELVRAAAAHSEATHIPRMLVPFAFSTLACICKV